jgi:hypothetical protein
LRIQILDSSLEQVRGDVLLLFHLQDHLLPRGLLGRVDWLLNGQISKLLHRQKFSGLPGEILLLYTSGKFLVEKALVVGLGWKKDLDEEALFRAYRKALVACSRMKARELVLTVPEEGFPLLAAGNGGETLSAILAQALQLIPQLPGLEVKFYEPDRERRKRLEAYLQLARSMMLPKCDFAIEMACQQEDPACGS